MKSGIAKRVAYLNPICSCKFYSLPLSVTSSTMCLLLQITAIMYPILLEPSNGPIDYSESTSSLEYMVTATHSRRMGYALSSGISVCTCDVSNSGAGEWSGTEPVCESMLLYCIFCASSNLICDIFNAILILDK